MIKTKYKVRKILIKHFSQVSESNLIKNSYFLSVLNTVDKSAKMYELRGYEREATLSKVLNKITTDNQIIGSKIRKDEWESGWTENLKRFEEQKNLINLIPKFVRNTDVIRWQGKFWKVEKIFFEHIYIKLLRTSIFLKYLTKLNVTPP